MSGAVDRHEHLVKVPLIAGTHPDLLLAGEQAVTLHIPIPDDELLAAELARLDRKIDAADAERRRLIDLYQGWIH